jgi:hypothetical protein
MKKYFSVFKPLMVFVLVFALNSVSLSQPPPPPSKGHGTADNSLPGAEAGAPIGEGMFLLIGLAGLYGGRKVYDLRKSLKTKEL